MRAVSFGIVEGDNLVQMFPGDRWLVLPADRCRTTSRSPPPCVRGSPAAARRAPSRTPLPAWGRAWTWTRGPGRAPARRWTPKPWASWGRPKARPRAGPRPASGRPRWTPCRSLRRSGVHVCLALPADRSCGKHGLDEAGSVSSAVGQASR